MNQNIEIALKQAFNLIEADQLDEARAILRPILESEKDNPDVWWVYSHAVTDVDTARLALNNVLRLDPNYPGASELFAQLQSKVGGDDLENLGELSAEPSFVPALPTSIPGISSLPKIRSIAVQTDDAGDEFPDDEFDDEPEDAFYRRPLFYVPLISLLVIVALAIVIFKPFSVSSPTIPTAPVIDTTAQVVVDLTPTSEAINPVQTSTVADATLSIASLPTDFVASLEPQSSFSDVESALAGFSLPADGVVSIENTSLGRTLIASICTTGGREMRTLLPQVTVALANASQSYSDRADGIAVKMIDCGTSTAFLQVGTTIADSNAFATGAVNEQTFQALWRPV